LRFKTIIDEDVDIGVLSSRSLDTIISSVLMTPVLVLLFSIALDILHEEDVDFVVK